MTSNGPSNRTGSSAVSQSSASVDIRLNRCGPIASRNGAHALQGTCGQRIELSLNIHICQTPEKFLTALSKKSFGWIFVRRELSVAPYFSPDLRFREAVLAKHRSQSRIFPAHLLGDMEYHQYGAKMSRRPLLLLHKISAVKNHIGMVGLKITTQSLAVRAAGFLAS